MSKIRRRYNGGPPPTNSIFFLNFHIYTVYYLSLLTYYCTSLLLLLLILYTFLSCITRRFRYKFLKRIQRIPEWGSGVDPPTLPPPLVYVHVCTRSLEGWVFITTLLFILYTLHTSTRLYDNNTNKLNVHETQDLPIYSGLADRHYNIFMWHSLRDESSFTYKKIYMYTTSIIVLLCNNIVTPVLE